MCARAVGSFSLSTGQLRRCGGARVGGEDRRGSPGREEGVGLLRQDELSEAMSGEDEDDRRFSHRSKRIAPLLPPQEDLTGPATRRIEEGRSQGSRQQDDYRQQREGGGKATLTGDCSRARQNKTQSPRSARQRPRQDAEVGQFSERGPEKMLGKDREVDDKERRHPGSCASRSDRKDRQLTTLEPQDVRSPGHRDKRPGVGSLHAEDSGGSEMLEEKEEGEHGVTFLQLRKRARDSGLQKGQPKEKTAGPERCEWKTTRGENEEEPRGERHSDGVPLGVHAASDVKDSWQSEAESRGQDEEVEVQSKQGEQRVRAPGAQRAKELLPNRRGLGKGDGCAGGMPAQEGAPPAPEKALVDIPLSGQQPSRLQPLDPGWAERGDGGDRVGGRVQGGEGGRKVLRPHRCVGAASEERIQRADGRGHAQDHAAEGRTRTQEVKSNEVPEAPACRPASGNSSDAATTAASEPRGHWSSTGPSPSPLTFSSNLSCSSFPPPVLPFCLPLCISIYFDPFSRTHSFPHCPSCSEQGSSSPAGSGTVCCCGIPPIPPPLCTPPCPFPHLSSSERSPSDLARGGLGPSSLLTGPQQVSRATAETAGASWPRPFGLGASREHTREPRSSSNSPWLFAVPHSGSQSSSRDRFRRGGTFSIQTSECEGRSDGETTNAAADAGDSLSTPKEATTPFELRGSSQRTASDNFFLGGSSPERELGSLSSELRKRAGVYSADAPAAPESRSSVDPRASEGPAPPQLEFLKTSFSLPSREGSERRLRRDSRGKDSSASTVTNDQPTRRTDHGEESVFRRILPLLEACARSLLAFISADDGRLHRWKQVFGSLQFGVRAFLNAPEVIYCRGVTRLAQQRLLCHAVHMLFVWIFLAVATGREAGQDARATQNDGPAQPPENSTRDADCTERRRNAPAEEEVILECRERKIETKKENTVGRGRHGFKCNTSVGGRPHGNRSPPNIWRGQVRSWKREKTKLRISKSLSGLSAAERKAPATVLKCARGEGRKAAALGKPSLVTNGGDMQRKGWCKVPARSKRKQISSGNQTGRCGNFPGFSSSASDSRVKSDEHKKFLRGTVTSTKPKDDSGCSIRRVLSPKKKSNFSSSSLASSREWRPKQREARAFPRTGEGSRRGTARVRDTKTGQGFLHDVSRRGRDATCFRESGKRGAATASSGHGVTRKVKRPQQPRSKVLLRRAHVSSLLQGRHTGGTAGELATRQGVSPSLMQTHQQDRHQTTRLPPSELNTASTAPTRAAPQAQGILESDSRVRSEASEVASLRTDLTSCSTALPHHTREDAELDGDRHGFGHRLVVDACGDQCVDSCLRIPVELVRRTAKECCKVAYAFREDSQPPGSGRSSLLLHQNSNDAPAPRTGRRQRAAENKTQNDKAQSSQADATDSQATGMQPGSTDAKDPERNVASSVPSSGAQVKTKRTTTGSCERRDNTPSSAPGACRAGGSCGEDAQQPAVKGSLARAPTADSQAPGVSANEVEIEIHADPDLRAVGMSARKPRKLPLFPPEAGQAAVPHQLACGSSAARAAAGVKDLGSSVKESLTTAHDCDVSTSSHDRHAPGLLPRSTQAGQDGQEIKLGGEEVSEPGPGEGPSAGGELRSPAPATVETVLARPEENPGGSTALSALGRILSVPGDAPDAPHHPETEGGGCANADTPAASPSSASPVYFPVVLHGGSEAAADSATKSGRCGDALHRVEWCKQQRPLPLAPALEGLKSEDKVTVRGQTLGFLEGDIKKEQADVTRRRALGGPRCSLPSKEENEDERRWGLNLKCEPQKTEEIAASHDEESGRYGDGRIQDGPGLLELEGQGFGHCTGGDVKKRAVKSGQLHRSRSSKEERLQTTPRKIKKAEDQDYGSSTGLSGPFSEDTCDPEHGAENRLKEVSEDEIGAAVERAVQTGTQCSTAGSTPPPRTCQQNKKRRAIVKPSEHKEKVQNHMALEDTQAAGSLKSGEGRDDETPLSSDAAARGTPQTTDAREDGVAGNELSKPEADVLVPSEHTGACALESLKVEGPGETLPQGDAFSEAASPETSSATDSPVDQVLLRVASPIRDSNNTASTDGEESTAGGCGLSPKDSPDQNRCRATENVMTEAGQTTEGAYDARQALEEVFDNSTFLPGRCPKKRRLVREGGTFPAENPGEELLACSEVGALSSQVSQQLCIAGHSQLGAVGQERCAREAQPGENGAQRKDREDATTKLPEGKEAQAGVDESGVSSPATPEVHALLDPGDDLTVNQEAEVSGEESAWPFRAVGGLESDGSGLELSRRGGATEKSAMPSPPGRGSPTDLGTKRDDVASRADGEQCEGSTAHESFAFRPREAAEASGGSRSADTTGDLAPGGEKCPSMEPQLRAPQGSLTSDPTLTGEARMQKAANTWWAGPQQEKGTDSRNSEGLGGQKCFSEEASHAISKETRPKEGVSCRRNLGNRCRPPPLRGGFFQDPSPSPSACYSVSPSSKPTPQAMSRAQSRSSCSLGASSVGHHSGPCDILDEWILYYRRWMGDRRSGNPAKDALLQHVETLLPDTLLVGFLQLVSHATQRTMEFVQAEREHEGVRRSAEPERKEDGPTAARSRSSSTDTCGLDQDGGSQPLPLSGLPCSALSERHETLRSFCGTSDLAAETALTAEALCRLLVGSSEAAALSHGKKTRLQRGDSRTSPYSNAGASSASISPCSSVSTASVYAGGTGGSSSSPFAALPYYPGNDLSPVSLDAAEDPFRTVLSLCSHSSRSKSVSKGGSSTPSPSNFKAITGAWGMRTEPTLPLGTEPRSKGPAAGAGAASSQEVQFPLLTCYTSTAEGGQKTCLQHSSGYPVTNNPRAEPEKRETAVEQQERRTQGGAQKKCRKGTQESRQGGLLPVRSGSKRKALALERRGANPSGGPSVRLPLTERDPPSDQVHKSLLRSLPGSPSSVPGTASESFPGGAPSSLCASPYCKASSSSQKRLGLCRQLRELLVEFACVAGRLAAVHMDHRRCCILRCRDLRAAARALDFCWEKRPSIRALTLPLRGGQPPRSWSLEKPCGLPNHREEDGKAWNPSCTSGELQGRCRWRQGKRNAERAEMTRSEGAKETKKKTCPSRRRQASRPHQQTRRKERLTGGFDGETRGTLRGGKTPSRQQRLGLIGWVAPASSSSRLSVWEESPDASAAHGGASDEAETDESFVPWSSSEDEDEEEEEEQQSAWWTERNSLPGFGSSSSETPVSSFSSSSWSSPSLSSFPLSGSGPVQKPLSYDSASSCGSSSVVSFPPSECLPLVRIPTGGSSEACEESTYVGSAQQGMPASLSIAEYLQFIGGCGCGCGDSDVAAEDFSGTEDEFLTTEEEEDLSTESYSESEDEEGILEELLGRANLKETSKKK